MKYHCSICGEDFNSLSCGGPNICGSCDCGIPPVQKKMKRQLAEEGAELIIRAIEVEYWKAKAQGRAPQLNKEMIEMAESEEKQRSYIAGISGM